MEETKIEVKVENGVKELIIRNGDALTLHEPEKVAIYGNINAVNEFFTKRLALGQLIDPKGVYILIDEEKRTIKAVIDEKNFYRTEIFGHLDFHHEFKKLDLNNDKGLDLKSMLKLLKFKKHLFADPAAHRKLIETLMGFTAKITTELENTNDLKGNKRESIITTALTQLELEFYVDMFIFKGAEKTKFKIQICFDVNGTDIKFWLESPDSITIIEGSIIEIMAARAEELKEYVVIYI